MIGAAGGSKCFCFLSSWHPTSELLMQVVELNVGGTIYATTRSTLCKDPDSMLARMFEGDLQPSHLDSQGRYFLDRDGGVFKHVLAYLRGEQHMLPCVLPQAPERLQLIQEARYFQLQGLEQQLTGSMTTGESSAGSWSQVHSSVALRQRMSQLRSQDGPRLQKLQDEMLDHFWSQFQPARLPSHPDAQVFIPCDPQTEQCFRICRLPTITFEELNHMINTYGNVLTYELGLLGYYIESHGPYVQVGIRNCWLQEKQHHCIDS